ncbi:L,D-transpeptidase catalytic domain protein [Francisella philomiragia]|uniref:L,D-transpeptidase family protein n=1 Tax=Francisella philomiragia TaxID=28110 RepID=UPI0005A55FC9|nr:L,D-transpeptidase family protein [Francisella philomiragia]AJI57189.1 L,D-transpeptidase catalytic domain protein [Francisella philomiragia]
MVSQNLSIQKIPKAKQLIVVTTSNWQSVSGKLWFFEKDNQNNWLAKKLATTVVVGKNGLAWADSIYQSLAYADLKKEGDSKSPAGIFDIGKTFGFANISAVEYVQIKTGIECVDDSNSKYYNQIVNSDLIDDKDWLSAENMSEIAIYKYGVEILYNTNPAIAKKGSCIFMHIWKSPTTGTEGCTAMAEDDIRDIQSYLDMNKNPILVQLTQDVYKQVQNDWQLPILY